MSELTAQMREDLLACTSNVVSDRLEAVEKVAVHLVRALERARTAEQHRQSAVRFQEFIFDHFNERYPDEMAEVLAAHLATVNADRG